MDHVNILREYGLFDAKVPRYTSYPPANRFAPGLGARCQVDWLAEMPKDAPVSIYVHVPFCRRICWFCACRTQGTHTLHPVEAYIDDLVGEITLIAEHMVGKRQMARLHLGGGTPTLLTVGQMKRVLDALDQVFDRAHDFEFSVEIDPTEAAPEILSCLAERGMRRASIGVQDFEVRVQEAIGRKQSYEQTRDVVDQLRAECVTSLNIDLLYGLPYQTQASLQATLRQVLALHPDRLALYGYAHVPHMSKRQVMIPCDALPSPEERFFAALSAREMLDRKGYDVIGIDHFARPSDSLALAARSGRLRRNFQGYTDDPCATLIGFGPSAISKFPKGFIQNAVSTAAYQTRIRDRQLAGAKGYQMSAEDCVVADLVNQIMCYGQVNTAELSTTHPHFRSDIQEIVTDLLHTFPKALECDGATLWFRPDMEALARVVAAHVDTALQAQHVHSAAI